jgi:hypothetical protein
MVTTIIKTIKPTGGDFTQPQDAWDDVNTIVGGTDLVAADTAVVFELDTGTYDEFACTDDYTCDATRNVTFRAAAGHTHEGRVDGGARIVSTTSSSPAITLENDFVTLEDLTIVSRGGAGGDYGVWGKNNEGWTCRRCIILADGNYSLLAQSAATGNAALITVDNVLAIGDGTSADRYIDLRGPTSRSGTSNYLVQNCSSFDSNQFVRVGANGAAGGSAVNVTLRNNFTGNCTKAYTTTGDSTITVSGSNNVGPSTNPFPAAIQAGSQTWDISQDVYAVSDGNTALYDRSTFKLSSAAGNDALDAGIGPAAESAVPTYDIAGRTRSGTTTQVGAFADLAHIWSSLVIRKGVQVEGALSCGPGQIGAVVDELTATGTASDQTAVMPAGVEGVWVQQLLPVGSNNDKIDIKIVASASVEATIITLGGSTIDANSGLGFVKLPITMPKNDGTYPYIKATGLDGGVWKVRVVAVGPGGPSWS